MITSPTQEPRQLNRTKSIKQFVDGMDDSTTQKTRQMFNLCDSDGDGVITKSELFKLVKELGYVRQHFSPSKTLPPQPHYSLLIFSIALYTLQYTLFLVL